MAESLQIILSGFGGQGIVLMGTVLGDAAVREGYWASGANSYGAQARGSACKAEVVISKEPQDYPKVLNADILIALSQEAHDRFLPQVQEQGFVLYDETFVLSQRGAKVKEVGVAGTQWALDHLNSSQGVNMFFLGVLAGIGGLISRGSLVEALRANIAERFLEANLKAVEGGLEVGLGLRDTLPEGLKAKLLGLRNP